MTTVRMALKAATVSAVHLELRDTYLPGRPGYLRWQQGHRPDPDDRASWWGSWHDTVAETTGRGVQIRRARIVSEPITDSTRYLYDTTFTNLAAGEDVRWLPRPRAALLMVPGTDCWVFDDDLVLFGLFTGDGQWIATQESRDPDVVHQCRHAFAAVWNLATPHCVYRPAAATTYRGPPTRLI